MDDSRLTPRKMQILKAIVDAHIAGGEPVGSKYLSQDVKISCSPATIRNEMAELEEMGYLLQPHTSAGRVPSELGYRYYVDALVRQYANTRSEIDEINEALRYWPRFLAWHHPSPIIRVSHSSPAAERCA